MGSAIYYLSPTCYYGTHTDSDEEYAQARHARQQLDNVSDLFYLPDYMFADTSVFNNADTAGPDRPAATHTHTHTRAGSGSGSGSGSDNSDQFQAGYSADTDTETNYIEMVPRYKWSRMFVPI